MLFMGATETKATTPAAAAVQTAQQYVLIAKLESGLDKPSGIAIDGQERVYLVGGGGVKVLDAEGKRLQEWKTSGAARCVATDSEGNSQTVKFTPVVSLQVFAELDYLTDSTYPAAGD